MIDTPDFYALISQYRWVNVLLENREEEMVAYKDDFLTEDHPVMVRSRDALFQRGELLEQLIPMYCLKAWSEYEACLIADIAKLPVHNDPMAF